MIAIIPARAGSKGLPGKNIKPLLGKPLIVYTIEAAQQSSAITEIFVSTDSEEIAKVAGLYGAKVPFLRPKELARDDSKAIDLYLFTVEHLNNQLNYDIEEFAVLQPTSPLRQPDDIDHAADIFHRKMADSVISVTEAMHHPTWAKKINGDGILQDFFPRQGSNKNRQEIESAFMPNGAVFVFRYSSLKAHCSYYTEQTYPLFMPAERSVDIDTQLDFEFAEFLLSRYINRLKYYE